MRLTDRQVLGGWQGKIKKKKKQLTCLLALLSDTQDILAAVVLG